MKNSVIGKIINEQEQIKKHLLNIRQLESIKKNSNDLKEIATLDGQIIAIQQQIAKIGGDKRRQNLIKEIQKFTNRKLITYFSIHGVITDRDSEIIEDYLVSNKVTAVDILVNSPGGLTDSAEKMIKICRNRTGNDEEFDFRTIVVNQAKSAATLFALGSSSSIDAISSSGKPSSSPVKPSSDE